MRESERIRCTIYRGGTSKGIFCLENDIPKIPHLRDKLVLRLLGSPDMRQIDGLGGADPLTSKFVMVGRSSREDADVDYTFAQVSLSTPEVEWTTNCGNLSGAVGPFAVDESLVKVVEPFTTVRIYNTNTKKIINATFPVKDGKFSFHGDYQLAGVPGTGSEIKLEFVDPGGAQTGKLLPTGNVRDKCDMGAGKTIEVTLVDAANALVCVKAKDIGFKGTELPSELDGKKEFFQMLENIRGWGSWKLGLAESAEKAHIQSPVTPRVAFFAGAQDYRTEDKRIVKKDQIDLLARLSTGYALTQMKMHKTYAGTLGIASACAAKLKGSVVFDLLSDESRRSNLVRLGHPFGVMKFEVKKGEKPLAIDGVRVSRTARRLMEGWAYVPAEIFG